MGPSGSRRPRRSDIRTDPLVFVDRVGNGGRVIGYVRVSTEEQGSSGAGLDAQRAAIRAECERRGWALVRVEEDVLSARTMNRPGLRSALESCRSGEVDGVVVAKLDRLSRSIVDFGNLLEEARRRGFNVVALDLGSTSRPRRASSSAT